MYILNRYLLFTYIYSISSLYCFVLEMLISALEVIKELEP